MVVRLSIVRRALLSATAFALAALMACSGDQLQSPASPEVVQPAVTPHPMNAKALARSGRELSPSQPTAIISNGTVQLGINEAGHLNVPGGTPSNGASSTTSVGLRFVPINTESTAPGCLCEGWGAANAGTGVTGYANISSDGGTVNIAVESFTHTATTAVSRVLIPNATSPVMRVTHDYHPSVTPNLYEAVVTIENLSGATLTDLRYTRTMDWDIAPNTFSEFSTIQGTAAATGTPGVILANNNGFNSANPLAPHPSAGFSGDFVDAGPTDHGAHFDFRFGSLAPGATRTFRIFYGAAANQAGALSALAAVGAEVYSFGQANCSNCAAWVPAPNVGHTTGTEGATTGVPNTFIFAFAGVGGTPLPPPGSGECSLGGRTPTITPRVWGSTAYFIGTSGNDVAVGLPNKINIFLMREGDDFAIGSNLSDSFDGGPGNDTWCGGPGNDVAFGKEGADNLTGSSGSDRNDGGHTPVPSSVIDLDTDMCFGEANFLCEQSFPDGATISSIRFKEDLAYVLPPKWSILGLRPVTFRYAEPFSLGAPGRRFGLIAEEVEPLYPEAVHHDATGRPDAILYQELGTLLAAEIQGQTTSVVQGVIARLADRL